MKAKAKTKTVSVAFYKAADALGMTLPLGHLFVRPIKPNKFPKSTNYGLIRNLVEMSGYKVTVSPATKREKRDLLATYTKLYKD